LNLLPEPERRGLRRAGYPVWNAGSTCALMIEAGAKMTMTENRIVPAKFEVGCRPAGVWLPGSCC